MAHTVLIVLHLIGTALGVGGATFAEIFFLKSTRDGVVDPTESSFLRVTYRVIRVGLFLLVVSGFGFLILYRFTGLEERLYSPILWSKLTLVLFILGNALLLQARAIPYAVGSAISLSAWYVAALLVPVRPLIASYSYLELMFGYLLILLVIALLLAGIRRMVRLNPQP